MNADLETLESVLVDLTGIDLNTLRTHPRNVFANSVRRVLDRKDDINQYAAFDSVLGQRPLDRDE
jgi:FXSXX-COOH protein